MQINVQVTVKKEFICKFIFLMNYRTRWKYWMMSSVRSARSVKNMQIRAIAHEWLIWRVARWLGWLPPPPQIRLGILVSGLFPLQKLIDKNVNRNVQFPISQHILCSLNIFVEIKVNKCWLKANSFFWEYIDLQIRIKHSKIRLVLSNPVQIDI